MDATDTQTPAQEVAANSDATKPVAQLFRYSTWIHVGPGAEACDDAESGTCGNPLHFHGWVRLPNQFQHADIRQKALAAKARRIRQLRDPESDANAILEADVDALRRAADQDEAECREDLIAEAVGREWWKRHLEAAEEVRQRDEFEHIDTDQERLAEIEALDEDKRPTDERDELLRHVATFGEAVDKARDEAEKPLRDSLEAKDTDGLIDMVREDRISSEASRAFMETYSKWQAFVGTLAFDINGQRPHRRVFATIDDLESADPEVVDALRETFARLETGLQRPPS